jgi:hypothetical protein
MVSDAVKLEREKRKTAREERMWSLVTDPTIKRLLLLSGIIAYSTYCARSEQNVGPVQSALAFALPGIGLPLIAADAGIKDKWALAAISAAGIGYTTGQMLQGWQGAGVDWPHEVWASLTPWKD